MEFLALGIALIIGITIGVVIGIFVGIERMRKAIEDGSVGDLRIDRSEPDEPPKPHLEVYKGNTVDTISQKEFVILKIVNENYLSHD